MADQGSGGLLSPCSRSRRIAAARPFLKGRVFNLGCGSGKLAGIVPPDFYLGVDIDEHSLDRARSGLPGSRISREANEEHEALLDRNRLEEIARAAGLRLANYRRFLFGANQLALSKRDTN